jgi:hypothetical protein
VAGISNEWSPKLNERYPNLNERYFLFYEKIGFLDKKTDFWTQKSEILRKKCTKYINFFKSSFHDFFHYRSVFRRYPHKIHPRRQMRNIYLTPAPSPIWRGVSEGRGEASSRRRFSLYLR